MTTDPSPRPAARGAVPRRTGPLADLIDLVLPACCAACQDPGVVLCADCASGWWPAPRRRDQDAPRLDRLDGGGPLPVWAAADYQGAVRRTVLAWKDGGRLELTRWLAALAGETALGVRADLPGRGPHRGALLVVPAPPSAAGRRRRGEDLLRPLAVAVAAGLTATGLPALPLPCLRTRRAHRDQVGLGLRGRDANLADRIAVRHRFRGHPALLGAPHRVLLIDDVLTTGATLAACRRVLDAAGQSVVAALVLAATPPPTHRSGGVEPRAAPG
ncbi:phosphoribosyltransferase family protein [Cellulomonas sp. RIT-PI-Y]|uniref:ComF family protein n=1 Tax=Cellulomonas sp. RIT-PI-Y TaxID=3035297 RepID=UPI0021DADC29|nr:phosphoribosyltransferase family protein [Cellulomonas sp. RIT-PI-Y]